MPENVELLLDFITRHPRLVLLTGAGASANSGIPTYRDAAGKWLRAKPIQHQEFIADPNQRRRYWGRSLVGWPGVRDARPNEVHLALTRLEHMGRIDLVITQNVDRLHQRAGTKDVVDLHGRLDRVICLDCGGGFSREDIQQELTQRNPQHVGFAASARPDGDADLSDEQAASVSIVDCSACGGLLMPDVVFFGGSVPRSRVELCESAIRDADALIVVGSSLQVYSGFRFCKQAHQLAKPIAIINEGVTRADELATLLIQRNAMAALVEAIDILAAQANAVSRQPTTDITSLKTERP